MRRTLVLPIVTELVPVLEPVGRDPFIDGPDDLVRCRPRRHGREAQVASVLVTAS